MLNELLKLPNHAQFATIKTITKPTLKKGGPQDVQKLTRRLVMLFSRYSSALNNKLKRMGLETRQIQPRTWGKRLEGTCLVEHKGKMYLETQVIRDIEVIYTQNGAPIDTSLVEPYLRPEGLVVWRDFALESVEEIRVSGRLIKNK